MRRTSGNPENQRSMTPISPGESIGHHSFNSSSGLNVAPLGSPAFMPSPRRVPVPVIDPFEDTFSTTGLVGSGVGYGHMHHNEHRLKSVSTAQSSPSIYPPSLPPSGDDDNTTDATQSPISDYSSDVSHFKFIASGAPPRPPRSPLRQSLMLKPLETYPITPPSSVSSHTPPSSPIVLDAAKIVNRRTLLDVQPQFDAKQLS
ncbi:hypothetical protein C0995_008783 [Termitomyces sp. Mi166|nr:hypothetical protein C0995_008783 [Termitomyces sp. Mi166\